MPRIASAIAAGWVRSATSTSVTPAALTTLAEASVRTQALTGTPADTSRGISRLP